MKIGVDITNVDLGTAREVTNIDEQLELLCKAIAHVDEREGADMRAIIQLAFELRRRDAVSASALLTAAMAVVSEMAGLPVDIVVDVIRDNFREIQKRAAERVS
jgi:hypothetical protein